MIRRFCFLPFFIASLIVIVVAAKANSSTFAFSYKLSPRLIEKVEECGDLNEPMNVWILFVDKGGESDKMLRGTGARSLISSRAILRRNLRADRIIDYYDLPVCEAYIEKVRKYVVRIRHRSRYLNGISAVVIPSAIKEISSLPFVHSIDIVNSSRKPIDYNLHEIRFGGRLSSYRSSDSEDIEFGRSSYQLQQIGLVPLLSSGYNGSGSKTSSDPVRIALLDTGFRRNHSALRNVRVVAEWDFVNGDSITCDEEGDPFLQDYHGTLVLGTIAGYSNGELIGPAWGAEYLLAKTEMVDTEIVYEEDNWVAGIEWADSAGADIVSSSLGYIDWYTKDDLDGNTAYCTIAADIAVSHGMIVINSAGNEGSSGIIAPADGDSVIAVGAVDGNGLVASFSSRGPTSDGRIKPDLVAMGVDVYTVSISDTTSYTYANGTSFSAPLIAGGCALLLEMHPLWSPEKVIEVLKSASSRAYMPDNSYGWGIPDFALASQAQFPGYRRDIVAEGPIPNPFSGSTNFALFLPQAAFLRVAIYNIKGEKIKTLHNGDGHKLWSNFRWDGTNERGKKVASGVYFISMEAPGYRKVLKAVLLY